jgi:preprotein translocase subunit Sss1
VPTNLKDEFTRVVPLALAGLALLGWILFAVTMVNKRVRGMTTGFSSGRPRRPAKG